MVDIPPYLSLFLVWMCYVVTTVFLLVFCLHFTSALLHACMSTTLAVLTHERFLPLFLDF